ncbi:MAG: NYN domain-containing protein [Clostridia bacterium]|nr:NYN domain-containing protein [Clostridia bacterium]
MKRCVVGILAHVDAGKTTLSEGLLYCAGELDKLGRVDKRDAFLDTHPIERDRGITIFSKQATLEFGDTYMTLIDTPGHVDFSCEAERALSVQDYAILIISAADGVTAHTKTLWNLLASRHIPTFIFVNKTDISQRRHSDLLDELKTVLSPRCASFSNDTTDEFYESVASLDERMIEEYFNTDRLSIDTVARAIAKRRVFPCFFGSALKMKGVSEFLAALDKYIIPKSYSSEHFGARVYKISRDPKGKRLTYVKITGGELKNKDTLTLRDKFGNETVEKVEEIRIYSGEKYKSVGSVAPGVVCALLGPTSTKVGEGLGVEISDEQTLTPVLDYRMILPKEQNPYETYMRLMALTEEDPTLALTYEPETHEIRVRLMGEIQTEVLTRILKERFSLDVKFDEGAILYKETLSDTVFGAGHFEPLRHYAEVHLRIDPLPEGSGIISASECPTDTLSLNWQRLIMTHIEERVHRGVLVGAPLTDVKITLTAGRAHLKHTEGGDFRQATYRAVRQGLMKAESVLLEPTFNFRMELPRESLGRAMTDITNMGGSAGSPEFVGDTCILEGTCPVATMRSYATELRAYTRGEGKLALSVGAYAPCHNADEVIAARAYDPVLDERNPAGSVFCKGGAGYAVPWNEADVLMHISEMGAPRNNDTSDGEVAPRITKKLDYRGTVDEDKELMRIFESTYGKIKPRKVSERVENSADAAPKKQRPPKLKPRGDEYVIIDGYNFIFANDELRKIAESDIARARDVVIRLLCDYTAFRKCRAVIAFDAYKRVGGEGSVEEIGAVSVVYTKEKQTADAYIERTTYEISDEHTVRVVTSDLQEQLIVLGNGALRVSAREFYSELMQNLAFIRDTIAIK